MTVARYIILCFQMAYLVSFAQICNNIEPGSSVYNVLKSEFDKLTLGTLSLPIYFPGTNYYKGLMVSTIDYFGIVVRSVVQATKV